VSSEPLRVAAGIFWESARQPTEDALKVLTNRVTQKLPHAPQVIRKRRVVERTFSWILRNRPMSRALSGGCSSA
jgi:hypothetical protein